MVTENEIFLLKIFIAQVIAAVSGTLSIAAANCLFDHGRIRWNMHSIWVSSSIIAICFPMVAWTCTVFLGAGSLRDVLIGVFGSIIFAWVYRNLPRFASTRKLGHDLSPSRSSSTRDFHQDSTTEPGLRDANPCKSSYG